MPTFMTKFVCTLLLTLCIATLASAGADRPAEEFKGLVHDRDSLTHRLERIPPSNYVPKRPGLYSRQDWATVIDETWGVGLPTQVKIEKFNQVFSTFTANYACYQNLEFDDSFWFTLGDDYLAEITAGVSRGRMAGILSHLTRRIAEVHTYCNWVYVTSTELNPGVPLLCSGCWGWVDHFGAAVTPTLGGEALVYKVAPDHPLGLEPGDIILGYDGVPWSELVAQLIDAELPITGEPIGAGYWYWGACPSSIEHAFLGAAGQNWHLFDTIDILKHDSGTTESLPTSLMVGHELTMFATEQLPVEGIPQPIWEPYDPVTCGTVQHNGLEIGYIYVWSWLAGDGAQFAAAIEDLWDSDALIIDIRFNLGGQTAEPGAGMALLFDSDFEYMNDAIRCGDPDSLYSMCYYDVTYPIEADPDTYYDRPIAVLVGPACCSMGDASAYILALHPEVRFFGRSPSMSPNYAAYTPFQFLPADGRYAVGNAYLHQDFPPDQYLTHLEFEVDEPVWLTPDDVAQGVDTVVEAALNWIGDEYVPVDVPLRIAALGQNHPNPFNPGTTIEYSLREECPVDLSVYALDGTRVATLVHGVRPEGFHRVTWQGVDDDGRQVASGTYLYRIEAGEFNESRTLTLVK